MGERRRVSLLEIPIGVRQFHFHLSLVKSALILPPKEEIGIDELYE